MNKNLFLVSNDSRPNETDRRNKSLAAIFLIFTEFAS